MLLERLAPADLARAFADELRDNVDAWYEEENTPATYAAFGERNAAIWNRITKSGLEVHDEVLRILREEQR